MVFGVFRTVHKKLTFAALFAFVAGRGERETAVGVDQNHVLADLFDPAPRDQGLFAATEPEKTGVARDDDPGDPPVAGVEIERGDAADAFAARDVDHVLFLKAFGRR